MSAPATTAPTDTTIEEALRKGAEFLRGCGVDSPRLEMELILAHALGIERIQLYVRIKETLGSEARDRSREMLKQRRERQPIAYILGHREFYSLKFEVTPDVLIPRPETELLVDRAVKWSLERAALGGEPPIMADIGTGSGAIAIAVAHEQKKRGIEAQWIATDISPAALEVARRNAERHGVSDRITFAEGHLLDPLAEFAGRIECLCSNPPYIPTGDEATLAPDVAKWEPHGALFSGDSGLDHIAEILARAPDTLAAGATIMMEIGAGQSARVAELAAATGRYNEVEFVRDLSGIERIAVTRRAD